VSLLRHPYLIRDIARATVAAWGLALAFMLAPADGIAAQSAAETEISHLLDFIETSRCEFFRNGAWYTATQARAHMDEKLALVQKANGVTSAESFIEKVASRSALTNLPYRVRCSADGVVPVADWLTVELRRYRAESHDISGSGT
jgi:hypothetical protein